MGFVPYTIDSPTQVALVDALTWDYQTTDELACQVWPWLSSRNDWHPKRDQVRQTVALLRRRGIKIDSLLGFGYRFAEDQ